MRASAKRSRKWSSGRTRLTYRGRSGYLCSPRLLCRQVITADICTEFASNRGQISGLFETRLGAGGYVVSRSSERGRG